MFKQTIKTTKTGVVCVGKTAGSHSVVLPSTGSNPAGVGAGVSIFKGCGVTACGGSARY